MKLEINQNCMDKTQKAIAKNSQGKLAGMMICPALSEDYWMFRVKLHKDQAVLGFPKFGMIGVGMAIEDEDSNTNLPLTACDTPEQNAERIANHIIKNKKYPEITKDMIKEAIKMIEKGAKEFCEVGERAYFV